MEQFPAYIMSPNFDGIESYDNGKKVLFYLYNLMIQTLKIDEMISVIVSSVLFYILNIQRIQIQLCLSSSFLYLGLLIVGKY